MTTTSLTLRNGILVHLNQCSHSSLYSSLHPLETLVLACHLPHASSTSSLQYLGQGPAFPLTSLLLAGVAPVSFFVKENSYDNEFSTSAELPDSLSFYHSSWVKGYSA